MAKLPGNTQALSSDGKSLFSLADVNSLGTDEKERFYGGLIPPRLFGMFGISRQTFCGADGERKVSIIAPAGLGLARIEVRLHRDDRDTVFFLDLADTRYHQMELSFCIISDPDAPRFDVDLDPSACRLRRGLSQRKIEGGGVPSVTFGEAYPCLRISSQGAHH